MTTEPLPVKITGTAGSDLIMPDSVTRPMTIFGLAGNDSILGGYMADLISGDDGDDEIHGSGGADTLKGGAGNDSLDGWSSVAGTRLEGGIGDDKLTYVILPETSAAGMLIGGDGFDTFNIVRESPQSALASKVTIADFAMGKDKIVFDGVALDLREPTGNFTLTNTLDGVVLSMANTNTSILLAGTSTRALGLTVAGGKWDVLNGTAGDDRITGTWLDVDGERLGKLTSINAGAGNDLVSGSGLGEQILGGLGHDSLNGNGGSDAIYGEFGNDVLTGGAGRDFLWGGEGNDTLNATTGADVLDGGNGNDVINAGDGRDATEILRKISAGAGNDTVNVDITYSAATISLGTGADVVNLSYPGMIMDRPLPFVSGTVISDFSLLEDTLRINGKDVDLFGVGKTSDLVVSWGPNGATISDAKGHAIASLTTGPMLDTKVVAGTATTDTINLGAETVMHVATGFAGNDVIRGGSKTLAVFGGDGNDTITLTSGGKTVVGGMGDDIILGGSTGATLTGNEGNDRITTGTRGGSISAGDGNDIVTIVKGANGITHTISGGSGTDQFVFKIGSSITQSATVIEDFQVGVDKIVMNDRVLTVSADLTHQTVDSGTLLTFEGNTILLQDVYL